MPVTLKRIPVNLPCRHDAGTSGDQDVRKTPERSSHPPHIPRTAQEHHNQDDEHYQDHDKGPANGHYPFARRSNLSGEQDRT